MNQRCYSGIRKSRLIVIVKAFLNKNRAAIIACLLLLCSIILSLCLLTTPVTAEKYIEREKIVTSVKIERGQSLWSIASQYITDEYKDMNTYIEEIKASNGLTSDIIHEGQYIIVPYYTVKNK